MPAQHYDEDAEIGVLGSILIDPEAAAIAFESVAADDFYLGKHQLIFSAMKAVYNGGFPMDEVLVCDELSRRGQLDSRDNDGESKRGTGIFRDYVGNLIVKTSSAAGVEDYCRIVKDHKANRGKIECLTAAINLFSKGDTAAANVLIHGLSVDSERRALSGFSGVETTLRGMLHDTEHRRRQMEKDGICTDGVDMHTEPIIGHPGADQGLLRRGEVMMFAAPASAGKTMALQSIAWSIITRSYLFDNPAWPCCAPPSFEDPSRRQVWIFDNELLANEGILRSQNIANAMAVPSDMRDLLKINFLRGKGATIRTIKPMIRALQRERPALIILDAIYKFYWDKFDENSNTDATKLMDELIYMASICDCGVMFAHHFSKGANSSGKDFKDKAAGAGAFMRAVDNYLSLEEHSLSENVNGGMCQLCVVTAKTRHWKPQEPITIKWSDTRWVAASDVPPIVKGREADALKIPKKKDSNTNKPNEYTDVILKALGDKKDLIEGALQDEMYKIIKESGESKATARFMLDRFKVDNGIKDLTKQDGPRTVCRGRVSVCKSNTGFRYTAIQLERAKDE